MTDTPSAILLLRLMSTGSNVNLWGGYINVALQTLERASKGYQAYATATDTTISWTNYSATNDFSVAFAKLTGVAAAAFTLTHPGYANFFGIKNSSGFASTQKVSGGTGVAVPTGRKALLYNDTVDVLDAAPTWISDYASPLVNNGDVVVKLTLEAAIAAASGLTAPFILVSAADTTPGYLLNKLNLAVSGAISGAWSVENSGADENALLTLAVGRVGLSDGGDKTSGFTAAVNTRYTVNIAGGGTITLPASATQGDIIYFGLGGQVLYTLNPNGLKINSATTNLVIDGNQSLMITYNGTTNGWG